MGLTAVQSVSVDDNIQFTAVKTFVQKAVKLSGAYEYIHLFVYVDAIVDKVHESQSIAVLVSLNGLVDINIAC